MRTPLLLVVFGLAVAGLLAADAKEDAVKKERQRYAGTWRVVSLDINGNTAPDNDARKIVVTNHADGTWVIEVDGRQVAKGTSEIDPTTKPKTLDFTATEGEGKGQTCRGIYELGTETRKLCYAPPGKERPTTFAAPAGSEYALVTFRRVKK